MLQVVEEDKSEGSLDFIIEGHYDSHESKRYNQNVIIRPSDFILENPV